MVYLADHPALAALEVRVHLDLPFNLLPADYVLMQVSTPDATSIEPADNTVTAGDVWLTHALTPAVRVPSALVPHAWNILLNPGHPEASSAEILSIEPFRFDLRLWQPLGNEG